MFNRHIGKTPTGFKTSGRYWWYAICCCFIGGLLSFGITFIVLSPPVGVHAAQTLTPGKIARPVKPFTALIRTEYYSASGSLGRSALKEYARFSDHTMISRVREEFPSRKESAWEVFDVRAEQMIVIDPQTKSKISRPYPKTELLGYLANMEEESCPGNLADLPRGELYFGYQTRRITTHDLPDGDQERWMIPELECFSVKEIQRKGSSHNEINAISLNEGEPSRDLALVPSDYTERGPAAVEELHRLAGAPLFGKGMTDKLEEDYQKRKVR